MTLFGFGRPRPGEAERRRIEDWAREAGGYGETVVVKVNEIVCADPACPGFETVLLIMAPKTRSAAAKIAKPLAEVTREDVVAAISASS
ncbi:hypothetical protein [Methylobacterium brachythecii]|uniref:Nitrate reductase n=1 Tax=Methylobacterium brachythecii TaxID=1176177 RepID=A0A7W6AG95_9HYPH|nr:hypothetical protein [Methylobacterium brachythecii]MBB3902113.1 hypothetical protein [Methylobacterium brachythecii]GLS44510.1 hypothetical protein GCM10007884_24980 [Methylobacterium brachythecii]